MRAGRIIAAFVAAPAAGVVTFAVLMIVTDHRVQPVGVLVVASLLAYTATLFVGVPVYLLSRRWRPASPLFDILATIGIAAIPTIAVAVMADDLWLIPRAFAGAAVTGWCFWAMTGRKSRAATA